MRSTAPPFGRSFLRLASRRTFMVGGVSALGGLLAGASAAGSQVDLQLPGGGSRSPRGALRVRNYKRLARMPVLFIGHGSPMNAILGGPFPEALQALGKQLPKPSAILVVSAHWITDSGTWVLQASQPETLHDFSGFPPALYDYEYRAPGHPEFAGKAAQAMAPYAELREDWGLDHGAWTVLMHLYPEARIPVFQVSLDIYRPGPHHYALGQALSALRDEGVMIIGSGNIVHNLRRTQRVPEAAHATQDWAEIFDEQVRLALAERDDEALALYARFEHAPLAVPTPDHYYPLLYALGAASQDGAPKTIYHSFQNGTISMRCLLFGA